MVSFNVWVQNSQRGSRYTCIRQFPTNSRSPTFAQSENYCAPQTEEHTKFGNQRHLLSVLADTVYVIGGKLSK